MFQGATACRLAAPGERQPYDLVGTAARTISQAPEDTQQRVRCGAVPGCEVAVPNSLAH